MMQNQDFCNGKRWHTLDPKWDACECGWIGASSNTNHRPQKREEEFSYPKLIQAALQLPLFTLETA